MRILIEVGDLMPAQQEWVRKNFVPEPVEPGQIKACVTLNHGTGAIHSEMAVTTFLLQLGEMVRVGRLAEAALGADTLPDNPPIPAPYRTPAPVNDLLDR